MHLHIRWRVSWDTSGPFSVFNSICEVCWTIWIYWVFYVHLQKSQSEEARKGETCPWVMDFFLTSSPKCQAHQSSVCHYSYVLLFYLWHYTWHVVYDKSVLLHSYIFNYLIKQGRVFFALSIVGCFGLDLVSLMDTLGDSCVWAFLPTYKKSLYSAFYYLPVTGMFCIYFHGSMLFLGCCLLSISHTDE